MIKKYDAVTGAAVDNSIDRFRWDSLQGLSGFLLLLSAAIFTEYVVACLAYRSDRRSWGISPEYAKSIAEMYGPVLSLTFIGLRDAFGTLIGGVKGKNRLRWVLFDNKFAAYYRYTLALLGGGAPLVALLLIAGHNLTIDPEVPIAVSAGIWAVTAGDIFHRNLKEYAMSANGNSK